MRLTNDYCARAIAAVLAPLLRPVLAFDPPSFLWRQLNPPSGEWRVVPDANALLAHLLEIAISETRTIYAPWLRRADTRAAILRELKYRCSPPYSQQARETYE